MSEQTRVPAGVTTGGQFATSARSEADVTLAPRSEQQVADAAAADLTRTAYDLETFWVEPVRDVAKVCAGRCGTPVIAGATAVVSEFDGDPNGTWHPGCASAFATERAARMAGAVGQTDDDLVDAQEMAARRAALVEESLRADSEGVGHRFEVEDLADGVVHAVDPGATGGRRAALLEAARESIDAAVAGGRAWACTGEPGPLQHWSDDADTIVDAALDAAWNASRAG